MHYRNKACSRRRPAGRSRTSPRSPARPLESLIRGHIALRPLRIIVFLLYITSVGLRWRLAVGRWDGHELAPSRGRIVEIGLHSGSRPQGVGDMWPRSLPPAIGAFNLSSQSSPTPYKISHSSCTSRVLAAPEAGGGPTDGCELSPDRGCIVEIGLIAEATQGVGAMWPHRIYPVLSIV